MQKPNEESPPQADRADRSRERERQDAILERAARQESWLSRLLRSRRERKGKPHPGSSGCD
jgi:hypothetical protein